MLEQLISRHSRMNNINFVCSKRKQRFQTDRRISGKDVVFAL